MLLKNKSAVIYGVAGAVGSARERSGAQAFAREGAHLYLTGRDLGAVNALANEITADGGSAHAAHVDALDEEAVGTHLNSPGHGMSSRLSRGSLPPPTAQLPWQRSDTT